MKNPVYSRDYYDNNRNICSCCIRMKRISREIEKQRLLKQCMVFEIPQFDIKVPVMYGTEHEVLSKAAGHFPNKGAVSSGNYCITGDNMWKYVYDTYTAYNPF